MADLTKGIAKKIARAAAKSAIDRMAKRVLWLVCAAFFMGLFSACASNPPSWFLAKAPQGAKLYGVGAGESLASAKQEAINDLAQSVQATINAQTQLQNTLNDDQASSTLSQHIHISTASLPLQNLQIINKSYTNSTYYVQVGISRAELAASVQKHLREILRESGHIDGTCVGLREFALLESSLKQAREIAQILQSLDHAPPREFARLEAIYTANAPAPKLLVQLDGVLEKELFLAEVAKFAKIATSPQTSGKPRLPALKLRMQANGNLIALHAVLQDCQGRIIAQKSFQEAQSTRAYAIRRSAVVLYKWLDEIAKGGG